MLIIPEIETVVILVPRTGSGSLRRAVHERYPRSMMLYRHMEADGVPAGYDRWRRIGVVRHPVERLWSLYKFCRGIGPAKADSSYKRRLRESVARPFEDWMLHNDFVFTNAYDSDGVLAYYPLFSVRHSLPENRKSQFLYLRPDLGTEVVPFWRLRDVARAIDVESALGAHNVTGGSMRPPLSTAGRQYVERVFAWDLEAAKA